MVLKLPFSWCMFYGAAAAFSLAGVVFWLRCPKLIRNFRNLEEFERVSNSKFDIFEGCNLLLDECRKCKEATEPVWLSQWAATTTCPQAQQLAYVTHLQQRGRVETRPHEGPFDSAAGDPVPRLVDVDLDRTSDAFKWVRDQSDHLRFQSLVIAWVLYGLGLAASLWVTIEGAIAVARVAAR